MKFLRDELRRLSDASLSREVTALDSPQDAEVVVNGARLLLFASNNYLGLANDPRVVEASVEAARRWGAGAGSARLVTGGVRLHDELESALASLKGTEAALLFSSGYLANLGAISALAGRDDAVFSDEMNHASIVDGARLSRAPVNVYRHNDVAHLEALLKENARARRKLVVTDSVFSMDGDIAPLPELVEVCERHGAMLMADEAHATGVVGPGGRGAVAHFGLEGRVPIVVGTLSKALGAAGGYVAGSGDLVAFLRNTARAFVFDTAPPAPVAGAALRAVEILRAEPFRVERVLRNAARLASGLGLVAQTAIVPIVVGAPADALRLSASMRAAGILVPAIRPPSVPEGTARLRATVMATHTDEHIDTFVRAYRQVTA